MNFTQDLLGLEWNVRTDQDVSGVTYVFIAPQPIPRLKCASDILYIGSTVRSLKRRYRDETNTSKESKNTQNTNTRTTHVLNRANTGIEHEVYFVKELRLCLSRAEACEFSDLLQIWVKSAYTRCTVDRQNPPLETYLLVKYAADHLELPPLNNRF